MILTLSILNIAFWIYRASKKMTVGDPVIAKVAMIHKVEDLAKYGYQLNMKVKI